MTTTSSKTRWKYIWHCRVLSTKWTSSKLMTTSSLWLESSTVWNNSSTSWVVWFTSSVRLSGFAEFRQILSLIQNRELPPFKKCLIKPFRFLGSLNCAKLDKCLTQRLSVAFIRTYSNSFNSSYSFITAIFKVFFQFIDGGAVFNVSNTYRPLKSCIFRSWTTLSLTTSFSLYGRFVQNFLGTTGRCIGAFGWTVLEGLVNF